MALYAELYKKFTLGDVSLDKKVIAAKNLFMRDEFCYIKFKEQLVLDWLVTVCKEGFNNDVWSVLKDCLNSEVIKKLSAIDIQRPTQQSLVELIINLLNQGFSDGPKKKKKKQKYFLSSSSTNVPEESLVRDCAILILESEVFLLYFRNYIGKYIQLSVLTLKSAARNNDAVTIFKYIQSLRWFYRQSQDKENTCKAFIQEILIPIIDAYIAVLNSEGMSNSCDAGTLKYDKTTDSNETINNLKLKILDLIRYIVFPREFCENVDKHLLCLFEGRIIGSWNFKCLCRFLVNKSSYSTEENLSYLYSFVFEAFIINFPDEFSAVYKLFVILCLFLGFEPDLSANSGEGSKYLLQSESVKNNLRCKINAPNREFSFQVLKNLIVILQKTVVRIEEKVMEVSFMKWMECLINSLISSEKSSNLYSVISSIVELHPLIVEPAASNIFKCILLQKKETDEEKESYRNCVIGILKMFIKLQKLQNLIRSIIIPTLQEVIDECRQTDRKSMLKISVIEVIPEGFGTIFGNTVGIVHGQMCVTMLRMFKVILLRNIVEPLECGEFDEGHKLHLGVVEHLLVYYLGGLRLAEQSVLKPVGLRFIDSLQELREVIGRLGIALIQQCQSAEVLASFLRLSLAVGEVQLLLLIYSPWSEQNNNIQLASSSEPSCPTDFHCLLSFLNPLQWKSVSDEVIKLGNKDCEDILVALVQQKLCVLTLFGDKIEHVDEMQFAASNFLAEFIKNSQSKLLDINFAKLPNLLLLSSLLPHEQILSVAEHIVAKIPSGCISSESINSLRNPTLNVSLLTALGWISLKKIGLILAETKNSIDCDHETNITRQMVSDILASLDFSYILSPKKKKREHILECFHLLAEKLNLSCSKVLRGHKIKGKISSIDYGNLLSYLNFLRNLPLLFLPERIQTAFALGLLAILILLQSYPQNEKQLREIEECEQTDLLVVNIRRTCYEILQSLLEGPTPAQLGNLIDIVQFVQMLPRDEECPKAVLHLLFEVGIEKSETLSDLVTAASLADEYNEKNLNKYGSPVSVILLGILKKTNLSSLDKKTSTSYKEAIHCILKSTLNQIDEHIKSGKVSDDTIWPLLETVCGVLSSSVEVETFSPYFQSFICSVFSVLQNDKLSQGKKENAQRLLETIMANHLLVEKGIGKNIVLKSFKLMKTPDLTAKLLKYAKKREFYFILEHVTISWSEKTKVKEFALPKAFVEIVRDLVIKKLENMVILVSSTAWKMLMEGNLTEKLQDFICFLIPVVHRPKVPLAPEVADIVLSTVVYAMRAQPNNLKYVLATIPNLIQLLLLMIKHRFPLIEDRVPAFMSALHSIMHSIVINSSADNHLEDGEIKDLANCALRVERLCKRMVPHSVHFRVISQFIVADFLRDMQLATIHHKMIIHVINVMYVFLDLCDSYAIAHLFQALPPASLELFKNVMSNYKKFYRYTGEV